MEKYQFGFGCMRLPLLNADDVTSFDFAKTEQLFDAYLNFGFTYFDTAYTYHGYQCEKAVRKVFSFKPADIVKELKLLQPIYRKTTNYGHFTKADLPWEQLDKVEELKKAVSKLK